MASSCTASSTACTRARAAAATLIIALLLAVIGAFALPGQALAAEGSPARTSSAAQAASVAKPQVTWKYVNKTWQLRKSDGALVKGWYGFPDGTWYYFDGNGSMVTGWQRVRGSWYYLQSSGAMKTGWLKDRGSWYYLKPDGAMATGWVQDPSSTWYYLSSDGSMATGWKKIGGTWYYLQSSGAMKTGWLYDNYYWYYLKDNGAMATTWTKVDGKDERFNADGEYMPTKCLGPLKWYVDSIPSDWYVAVRNGTLSQSTIDRLNNDMLRFWDHGHDVGFVLVDLATGATISGNPRKAFQGCSTIKGPYCCAVAKAHPYWGYNRRSVIRDAVVWSINEQYQALRAEFGTEPMRQYMKEAGVSQWNPSDVWIRNMRAIDLAKLWIRTYEFFGESENGAWWIKPLFKESNYTFLRETLGSKYWVMSKPGWILASGHNDAGIIMAGDHPYVVAIMSSCHPFNCNQVSRLARHLDEAHSELVRNL